MDTRILDIGRTATLRRGEIIETDHATNGSGKLDLADFLDVLNNRFHAPLLHFMAAAGATWLNIPAFRTGDFVLDVRFTPATVVGTQTLLSGNGDAPALSFTAAEIIMNKVDVIGSERLVAFSFEAGKTYRLIIVKDAGTLYFYVDGKLIDSVADASDYSAELSRVGTYSIYGNHYSGQMEFAVYNLALSAAEVFTLFRSGRVAAHYNNASNSNLFTSAWINNSNTDYDFNTFGGASATGFSATYDGIGGGAYALPNGNSATRLVIVGQKFLLDYTLVVNSGAAPQFRLADNNVIVNLVAGTHSVVMTSGANGEISGAGIVFAGAATDFVLSNMKLTPLGLLSEPEMIGAGPIAPDRSGNNAIVILPDDGRSGNIVWSRDVGDQFAFTETFVGNGYALARDGLHIPPGWRVAASRRCWSTRTPSPAARPSPCRSRAFDTSCGRSAEDRV